MFDLKLDFSFFSYGESLNDLNTMFDNLKMDWIVLGEKHSIKLNIKKNENKMCLGVNKLLFNFDANIEQNKIFNINLNDDIKDSNFLTKSITKLGYGFFDDFIEFEIMPNVFAFVFSAILTNPKIDFGSFQLTIYFKDKIYIKKNIVESCVFDYLSECKIDMFQEQLSIQKCWDWIINNTSLQLKKQKDPIYFSAFTYLLKRDIQECLIYSIIGLENLFCNDIKKGISYYLRNRISLLYDNISAKDVNEFYSVRSKFIHGNFDIGVFYKICESSTKEDKDIYNSSILAMSLLIETIRKLIVNNANELVFENIIKLKFGNRT